ncbi:MAG: hypothetical protein KAU58_01060 [Candidatus Omnitrophica bacterium]|nr:hypothetical protein [Candidatus Omnitrophota bacterium]
MTEQEAVARFKKDVYPLIVKYYGEDDVIAMREAFNNYTDMMCKNGEITLEMYETMDNPF